MGTWVDGQMFNAMEISSDPQHDITGFASTVSPRKTDSVFSICRLGSKLF